MHCKRMADSKGFALIVVLMVIVMLTVLGTVAINTTLVDLEIAKSHKELRESFYLAEAAVMEGVQRLINNPVVDRQECFQFWHHDRESIEQNHLDFKNPGIWITTNASDANARQSQLDHQTYFLATEGRVAGGSSLIATGSRLYVDRVYGFCRKYNADNLVLAGYYMRY